MSDFPLRSPAEKVGGLFYFGRMIDKIRAREQGVLPAEYQPNLGRGFDESCVAFLEVDYGKLVARALKGGTEHELLDWCFARSRRPSEREIHVWNAFMRKRGWNDEITEILVRRKAEAGFAEREDIQTMFAFIDADEGRPLQAKPEDRPRT